MHVNHVICEVYTIIADVIHVWAAIKALVAINITEAGSRISTTSAV